MFAPFACVKIDEGCLLTHLCCGFIRKNMLLLSPLAQQWQLVRKTEHSVWFCACGCSIITQGATAQGLVQEGRHFKALLMS